MIEKRGKQRFELRLSVEIVLNSSGLRIKGETRNVSSSGVLFTSEERIAIGEPIDYLIAFPRFRRARRNVQLLCSGKVLREDRNLTFAASLDRHQFARQPIVSSSKKDGDPGADAVPAELLIDVLDSVSTAKKAI